MKRKMFFMWIAITLLLMSCSSPQTDLTSNNGVAVAMAQNTSITEESTAPDEKTDETTEVTRPVGWSEETHDKSADPNYEAVFAQDEVKRIDFTIDPLNWAAMQANMTELYGGTESQSEAQGMPDTGERPNGQGMPADGERPEGMERPAFGGDAPPAQPDGQGMPADGEMPEGMERPAFDGDAPPAQPDGQGMPADGEMPEGMERPAFGDERPEGQGRPGGGQMGGKGGGGGNMMMDSSVNPIYVPVTVEFEGDTWTNVGLRYKGNSSLRSSWGSDNMKLPFRLDFDEFEDDYPEIDDQRFYGFKQLAFSSNYKDASFLREKVTADIFREAGVPAAQTAFYEVYIDYGEGPIYFGLYTLTEIVDDTVIETQFEDDEGNVYKPEGSGATFAAGSFSETAFEKQSNQSEADWSDVLAVYDALHADLRSSDPAAWRSGLEEVFDVNGFLNWLAVNSVVQNWDTYGSMSHNYYLYFDNSSEQIVWIPWDNNEALSSNQRMGSNLSIDQENVGDNWPLIRYLLDDEVYYAQYRDYVAEVINGAFEPSKMEATYRELAELIAPYALNENAGYTNLQSDGAFYSAIEELVEHAYTRYAVASDFLAQ